MSSKKRVVPVKDRYDEDSSDSDDSDLGVTTVISAQDIAKRSAVSTSGSNSKTTIIQKSSKKPANKKTKSTGSSLFGESASESDTGADTELKVNQEYAQKYAEAQDKKLFSAVNERFIKQVLRSAEEEQRAAEKRERRRQLKLRKRHQEDLIDEARERGEAVESESQDSELSSSEDENAEFLDERTESEFIDLLHKLRTRDPTIYNKDAVFFSINQETPGGGNNQPEGQEKKPLKASKGKTYADVMADQRGLEDLSDNASDLDDEGATNSHRVKKADGSVETIVEYKARQAKIKAEFLAQLQSEEQKIAQLESSLQTQRAANDAHGSDMDASEDDQATKQNDDDSDFDEWFGAPTMILDPRQDAANSDDDEDDDDDDEIVADVYGKIVAKKPSQKFQIQQDLAEAQQIVQSLKKTRGQSHDVNTPDTFADRKTTMYSDEAKEQFLAKYVLGGWWKNEQDGDSFGLPASNEMFNSAKMHGMQVALQPRNSIEQEDDIVTRANDLFEQQLNFRYNEDEEMINQVNSGQLTSHPRSHLIGDSLRQEVSKKKKDRLKKLAREKQEKIQRLELAKRLQAAQTKLLHEKLRIISKYSGLDDIAADSDDDAIVKWSTADLLTPFDPEEHDKRNREVYFDRENTYDDEHLHLQSPAKVNKTEKSNDRADNDDDTSDSSNDNDDSSSDSDDDNDDLALEGVEQTINSQYEQRKQEVDDQLAKLREKNRELRAKLPSILRERAKQQLLEEQRQDKAKKTRVANYSDSEDSDDADDDDSQSSKKAKDAPTPDSNELQDNVDYSLKQLDDQEAQEAFLAQNIQSQLEHDKQNMLKHLEELTVAPEEEALTWWQEQQERILSDPSIKSATKGKSPQDVRKIVLAAIKDELEADDDEKNSCIVDFDEAIRTQEPAAPFDYSKLPTKANSKNPLLGGFRFQYVRVPKSDYGMSLEDILNTDDSVMNQKVSLKKLAPYREDNNDQRNWKDIQEDQRRVYREYMQATSKSKPSQQGGQQQKRVPTRHTDAILDDLDEDVRSKREAKARRTRHTANWSTQTAADKKGPQKRPFQRENDKSPNDNKNKRAKTSNQQAS